jgi:hypothetical protein
MARQAGITRDLLAMALIGYETQKKWIIAAIADIQAQLGHRGPGRPVATKVEAAPKKHTMSAAGRRRVAAAQRARWAAVKRQAKSVAKAAAPKKRKISAAARKRIGDAARKRWAAQRKAGGKKGKAGAKAAS